MSIFQRFSDRLLGMFVPQIEASAGTFQQYCGCYGGLRKYLHFRTCYYTTDPRDYTCGPCVQGNPAVEC